MGITSWWLPLLIVSIILLMVAVVAFIINNYRSDQRPLWVIVVYIIGIILFVIALLLYIIAFYQKKNQIVPCPLPSLTIPSCEAVSPSQTMICTAFSRAVTPLVDNPSPVTVNPLTSLSPSSSVVANPLTSVSDVQPEKAMGIESLF
jgi:Fe2+ transport system protein B